MLRLKTFGQPLVERGGNPIGGAARQRRVIALLTVVAVGRARGVSRDRVLGLLWSEREPEKARQSLTQSLYHARKALSQDDLFIASADLRLNPDVITSDVDEFAHALEHNELSRAVLLYHGPFLDGFHLNDAPEFERWVSDERAMLHAQCVRALEQLATQAAANGDFRGAAEWWKQLAVHDPLNSRIAIEVMQAMAKAGDRAGAIRHAQIHQTLLRDQLDVTPHPAIAALADELRMAPLWMPNAGATERSNQPAPASSIGDEPTVATHGVAGPITSVQPSRLSRRRLVIGFVVVVVAAAIAIGTRLASTPRTDHRAGELVVVAPFRVSGADASLGYLREGLIDLLVTTLSDDRSNVADPGAVLTAWRRAGFSDGVDFSRDRSVEVAKRLGGTRLVTGSVVGTPTHLVVSAAITSLLDGRLRAQASADGPADSLTMIVDRLVARLLAKEAGEWDRLATQTSSSPQALRAYLDGQAAYRRGAYDDAIRQFRRALDRDGAFAMAGLALATAADRIDDREDRARGLAVAWAARSELTARDSAYLQALAGPRYPFESSSREQLTAWERAATSVSDRADVWHELGERLFFDGQALGLRDWSARATAAFRRAAALDPAFASPLQYLLQLAAVSGDTANAHAAATMYLRLDSSGELAPFVRWRSTRSLGDRASALRLQREITSMPVASLRAIALSSQYNGIGLADAERAIAALATRAARGAERADALLARHALALNEGARGDALDATEALAEDRARSGMAARLQVTDFLYGRGDSTAAARAASRLIQRLTSTGVFDTGSSSSPSMSVEAASNTCVVRQWLAWSSAAPVLDSVATMTLGRASRDSSGSDLCQALVNAIDAAATRSADASQRAARVDSLVLLGVGDEELRDYVGVALSRVYIALGDNRRALEAVRRRPYMRRWPHYLAAHLELEGKIAESLGDSASAVAAYTRYLALRRSPEAESRDDVAAARAGLTRLSGSTHRTR